MGTASYRKPRFQSLHRGFFSAAWLPQDCRPLICEVEDRDWNHRLRDTEVHHWIEEIMNTAAANEPRARNAAHIQPLDPHLAEASASKNPETHNIGHKYRREYSPTPISSQASLRFSGV